MSTTTMCEVERHDRCSGQVYEFDKWWPCSCVCHGFAKFKPIPDGPQTLSEFGAALVDAGADSVTIVDATTPATEANDG